MASREGAWVGVRRPPMSRLKTRLSSVPLTRSHVKSIALDIASLRGSGADTPRYFCLNSGSCGSKYLAELVTANGYKGSFHEKFPDLDEPGVRHYLDGAEFRFSRPLLQLTRRRVFLESNNRLFAMAGILSEEFPGARFIHLHRNGLDHMNSGMNKTIWPDVYSGPRLRYASRLAGPLDAPPFERACWYWRNYNERIADDLEGHTTLSLKYEDLVAGRVEALAEFIDRPLDIASIPPVNTKDDRKLTTKRYESPDDWPAEFHATFDRICGATMERLGYG